MKYADRYERLAQLTGLPSLACINDPERLERLVTAAEGMLNHSSLRCPIRYLVAYRQYAQAAHYRLENPEEI